MLSWKGVKQHLPSKVAKGVPHWLSKKKRENDGADGSAKDQSGRYKTSTPGQAIGTGHHDLHKGKKESATVEMTMAICCLVVALHTLLSFPAEPLQLDARPVQRQLLTSRI